MGLLKTLGLDRQAPQAAGYPEHRSGSSRIGKAVQAGLQTAGVSPLTATQVAVAGSFSRQVGLPPIAVSSEITSASLRPADAYIGDPPQKPGLAERALPSLKMHDNSNHRMMQAATALGIRHGFVHDPHHPTDVPRMLPLLLRSGPPGAPPRSIIDLIPVPQATMPQEEARFATDVQALFTTPTTGSDGTGAIRQAIVQALPPASSTSRERGSRSQLPFARPLILAHALSIVAGGDAHAATKILPHLKTDLLADPDAAMGIDDRDHDAAREAWHVRKILSRTAHGAAIAVALATETPNADRQARALGTALEISQWLLQQETRSSVPGRDRLLQLRGACLLDTAAMLDQRYRGSLAQRAMHAALQLAQQPDAALQPAATAALFAWQQGIHDDKQLRKVDGRMRKAVAWVGRADRQIGSSPLNVLGKRKNPFAAFAAGPAGITKGPPGTELNRLDASVRAAIAALAEATALSADSAAGSDPTGKLAWREAVIAIWADKCHPSSDADTVGTPPRPLECAFDRATLEKIRRRALDRIRRRDTDANTQHIALGATELRAMITQSPFVYANLAQWADEGDSDAAKKHLADAAVILDGDETRPANTRADGLREWFRNIGPQLRLRNRMQVSHGGVIGLSNTIGPFGVAPASISPDLVATRARSAVVGFGCTTAGGEFRIGVQRDVSLQLGVVATAGPQWIFKDRLGADLSVGGGGSIGADISRFEGVTIRTKRLADPRGGARKGLIAERGDDGSLVEVGIRQADGSETLHAGVPADTPRVAHPDGANRDGSHSLVKAVAQEQWKVGVMNTADFFVAQYLDGKRRGQPPAAGQVWENFAVQFAPRDEISVSWQDQRSLTPRQKLFARASARATIAGYGLGGTFTLSREATPAIVQNRSDNTGGVQRTLIQLGDSGRWSLAHSWGLTPKPASLDNAGSLASVGAPPVYASQSTITFLDRGVTANFKPTYEFGKLNHELSIRELEFTDPQEYLQYFNRPENRAALDRLMGKQNNDQHLAEMQHNFVPGQRLLMRWRLTPEAGEALEMLRVQSDMQRAAAAIARQDGHKRAAARFDLQATALQEAAVALLAADDARTWQVDGADNAWDAFGTLINQDEFTERAQGPNWLLRAQTRTRHEGTRELAFNTPERGDMAKLRAARADRGAPRPQVNG